MSSTASFSNHLVAGAAQQKGDSRLVTLVKFLIDNSKSMGFKNNWIPTMNGLNQFLNQVRSTEGEVFVDLCFLNNSSPPLFRRPSTIADLTQETYRLSGGTPLFKRGMDCLKDILTETRLLMDRGDRVQTYSFFFTDGGNNTPDPTTADDVRAIVDVMQTCPNHVIGGCGISDGRTNYHEVFRSMGIPDEWIMELKCSDEIPGSIGHMGDVVSHGSTDEESYSQTRTTGFTHRNSGDSTVKNS